MDSHISHESVTVIGHPENNFGALLLLDGMVKHITGNLMELPRCEC